MGTFNTIPPNPFPPSSEDVGNGGGGQYVLPIASANTLGGVMIGNGLTITDGVLSADRQNKNYSTTEQDTGRKWVDGKNIYSKTYSVGALPSSSTVTVQNDIENFGFVVSVETMGISSDGYSFSNDGLVMNYCSSTSFVFRTTFDATGYDGYVTVYYTKTT